MCCGQRFQAVVSDALISCPETTQVEISKECQAVLRARMHEGNLPTAPISCNVEEYIPATKAALQASALVAGFPCQAGQIANVKYQACDLCLQGLSVAGSQGGMSDPRSKLIKHTFRVWDKMTKPPRPQFQIASLPSCHFDFG